MRGAEQPGIVGMMADGNKVDGDPSAFSSTIALPIASFADPALAEAAADDDPFGVLPAFGAQELPHDQREFARKFLDCAVDQAGGLGLP